MGENEHAESTAPDQDQRSQPAECVSQEAPEGSRDSPFRPEQREQSDQAEGDEQEPSRVRTIALQDASAE
jgi:hypothetical protein